MWLVNQQHVTCKFARNTVLHTALLHFEEPGEAHARSHLKSIYLEPEKESEVELYLWGRRISYISTYSSSNPEMWV